MFEEDGDRKNRQRLREFSGFHFYDDSEEYRNKMNYVSTLSFGDLTSICNILGINYEGNKEQVRERILKSLIDINQLEKAHEDDDATTEDDEDELINDPHKIGNNITDRRTVVEQNGLLANRGAV